MSDFLDRLADEVSEYEAVKNQWGNRLYEEVEERINEHQDMMEEAKQKGLVKISEGGFRTVFRVESNPLGIPPGSVIKISKYDGTRQNADAVNAYQSVQSSDEKLTAEIIDWGDNHRWIVQERAKSAKPGDSRKVREKLTRNGFSCSDIRKENCGRIDGEPVLIDLGLLV